MNKIKAAFLKRFWIYHNCISLKKKINNLNYSIFLNSTKKFGYKYNHIYNWIILCKLAVPAMLDSSHLKTIPLIMSQKFDSSDSTYLLLLFYKFYFNFNLRLQEYELLILSSLTLQNC